jgi:hypothetical protein
VTLGVSRPPEHDRAVMVGGHDDINYVSQSFVQRRGRACAAPLRLIGGTDVIRSRLRSFQISMPSWKRPTRYGRPRRPRREISQAVPVLQRRIIAAAAKSEARRRRAQMLDRPK